MNDKKDKIVYVRLDTWNDMKDAEQYLEELRDGKHDSEINYSEVWYDQAEIYCITTTESYIEKHPELTEFIQEQDEYFEKYDILRPYYPEYNPDNFGVNWHGEYDGWAPYKDFDRQLIKHLKEQETSQIQNIDRDERNNKIWKVIKSFFHK